MAAVPGTIPKFLLNVPRPEPYDSKKAAVNFSRWNSLPDLNRAVRRQVFWFSEAWYFG